MISTIYRKFVLFVTLIKFRRGDYLSAYSSILKICSDSSYKNIKIWLFRSYLAVLSEKDADAKVSLLEFYRIIFDKEVDWEKMQLNDDERVWLLAFAEFLLIDLTGRGSRQFGRESLAPETSLESLDFSKVRNILQRMFPTSHYCDVRELIREALNNPLI